MGDLTHIGPTGAATMVDVGSKAETERVARASGCIRMEAATLSAVRGNQLVKGEVIPVARVAGILAAKRTAELVPLCHTLFLTAVELDFAFDEALPGIRVEAVARTTGKTGVEMEAIVAVSVALVTIYDMAKSRDRGMVISEICLLEKSGGRSGHWTR